MGTGMQEEIAEQAARALDGMRQALKRARECATMHWPPPGHGDFGQHGWTYQAATKGLQSVEYLRNLGVDWLAGQEPPVRAEVDAGEAELRRFKMGAVQKGAGPLPSDMPPYPS